MVGIMKAPGRMINVMAVALKDLVMVIPISEDTKTEKFVEKEFTLGLILMYMMANGLTV